MPVTTTLNAIRKHSPWEDGWKTLLNSLGKTEADDDPLSLAHILHSNGIEHATWVLRCLPEDHKPRIVRFAADCAEHVLHIWEARYPEDLRPREAIDAARKWADNPTEENKKAAARAAVVHAARAADAAAVTAAWAAWAAARAVAEAAYAWAAVATAADAAAARAAAWSADAAARAAASAEHEHQAALFLKYFGE